MSIHMPVREASLFGIGVLFSAILLAWIACWLIFYLLNKAVGTKDTLGVLPKVQPAARLALMTLAINIVLPLVVVPPNLHAILSSVVALLLIACVGWFVLIVLHALTDVSISRHNIDVEDNLEARKMRTRLRVLRQVFSTLVVLFTLAAMLMVIPNARAIGVSLFASAGVAGIVVGFAARPVLSNLLAGIQIALTQPIRIDDAVVIEGEWGWIEEITATYVVVKIWDWRRLVVPLSQVIEKPFQNWTRETAAIIGSVFWHVDYSTPIEQVRKQLEVLLNESAHWDGQVQVLQVTDCGQQTITLRALMSAKNSPTAWDLRCEIREKMILWLQEHYPNALPKHRVLAEPKELDEALL